MMNPPSQKDFNDKFFINTNKYNLRQSQIPLIVDIKDTGSDTALTGGTTFRAKLNEPIIIDKLSEVYLDNFMTINSLFGNTPANAAFAIKINEFSSKTAGASTDQTTRGTIQSKLLIPNENINTDNFDSLVVHKGKKMNYVCEINPTKIHEISGTITNIEGNSIFGTSSGEQINIISLETDTSEVIAAGTKVHFFAAGSSGSSTILIEATVTLGMALGADTLYYTIDSKGTAGIDFATALVLDFGLSGAAGALATIGTAHTTTTNSNISGVNPRALLEFLIVEK